MIHHNTMHYAGNHNTVNENISYNTVHYIHHRIVYYITYKTVHNITKCSIVLLLIVQCIIL